MNVTPTKPFNHQDALEVLEQVKAYLVKELQGETEYDAQVTSRQSLHIDQVIEYLTQVSH